MIAGFKDEFEFLSNFDPCSVTYDGMVYPSVEHAYQAAKTLNLDARIAFVDAKLTAAKAKKLGRKLPLRTDWDTVKIGVMEECLRSKFSNRILADKLLNTNDEELVEANWWGDVFWGVCDGIGENRLGKLLMKIRAELRSKSG